MNKNHNSLMNLRQPVFIMENQNHCIIDDRAPLRAVTLTMAGCQELRGLENATCLSRTTSGSLIKEKPRHDDNMIIDKCGMIGEM